MPSIFLSHSSKDKFFVRELAERLKNTGVKVWLDEAEIKIGDSLTDKVGKAIDETDFVGVVLSHNSVNSEWVQRELQVAMQKEFSGRKIVVLPLVLEAVEIPPFLRDKLYADFTTPENYLNNFPRLLKALGIEEKKTKAIPEPAPQARPAPTLTSAERRLADFEDISISELDHKQSFKPDPAKLLYNIHLRLSSSPPSEWQEIFEAERRFPRHNMWRRAWVEGQHIIIHCVPDELEKYHLKDLVLDFMMLSI